MVIALMLTALLFVTLYGITDQLRQNHRRYRAGLEKSRHTQNVAALILEDLAQVRQKAQIVHDAGYDRIALYTANSLYGIARPWVHYYVSKERRALVRIEATAKIDFLKGDYGRTASDPLFFADVLATGCRSFRIHDGYDRFNVFIRCESLEPVTLAVFKGSS